MLANFFLKDKVTASLHLRQEDKLFKMYTWFLYSSLCKKSYFRTSTLIKHLFLWQKTFSPPAMYQTIWNTEGEPLQTRPAEARFFMVALQLDPRHTVLHKGQWFSSSDNIYCIFKDWWMLLLSSKCISLFGATWSTRLGQKKPVCSCWKFDQHPQPG